MIHLDVPRVDLLPPMSDMWTWAEWARYEHLTKLGVTDAADQINYPAQ